MHESHKIFWHLPTPSFCDCTLPTCVPEMARPGMLANSKVLTFFFSIRSVFRNILSECQGQKYTGPALPESWAYTNSAQKFREERELNDRSKTEQYRTYQNPSERRMEHSLWSYLLFLIINTLGFYVNLRKGIGKCLILELLWWVKSWKWWFKDSLHG